MASIISPRMLLRAPKELRQLFTAHALQYRQYSSAAPNARLNVPVDFSTTPLLAHTANSTLSNPELPESTRKTSKTTRITYHEAINSAMRHCLTADDSVLLFGEDIAFGGVFRCSANLSADFGAHRVFNTPLSEQGIVGFAIGAAAQGMRPIAEIQFADYVYPAFDQLVNEAAKRRFMEGGNKNVGGLVVRMPCGGVGHGGLYHSQSPEALFSHIPGLRVVMPRGPVQAKGLLIEAVLNRNDPVVFMEPKNLYRAAKEEVPVDAYALPLSKAEVLKQGSDVTIISYGQPLYYIRDAIAKAEKDFKCSIELIDLRTIYPWDRPTILASVRKTGRAIIVHESMVNAGVGAEVAATIQEQCFLRLEAPVQRVAGWSTHVGLVYEKFLMPDVVRVYENIRKSLEY